MSDLTKADKLRQLIRREVERGMVPGLTRQINAHAPYVKKLVAHPKFMQSIIDELVEIQLPFYMSVSDAAADAAHAFFMTDLGLEWCNVAGNFSDNLQMILAGFLQELPKRLDALESN